MVSSFHAAGDAPYRPPAWQQWLREHVNYFRLHLAYILVMTVLGGVVLYGIERHAHAQMPADSGPSPSLIDALFTACSAVCVTGLIVLDTSQLQPASLVVVTLLILLGGPIQMSLVPLLVRRYWCRQAYGDAVLNAVIQPSGSGLASLLTSSGAASSADLDHEPVLAGESGSGGGGGGSDAVARLRKGEDEDGLVPLVQQRALQYHSFGVLIRVIVVYLAVVWGLSFALLWAYLSADTGARREMLAQNCSSAVGWAAFHAVSAFHNAGFSLFASNLIPMRADPLVMLLTAVLILCGNTLFPVLLRGLVVIAQRLNRREAQRPVYEYLLNHPRECYTHLFPPLPTLLLLLAIIVLNLLEIGLFLLLDWNISSLDGLGSDTRFLISVVQSISTRAAGFNFVDMLTLSPATKIVEVVLMYIATVPVVLTMRSSSVIDAAESVRALVQRRRRGRPGRPSLLRQMWQWLQRRNFLLRQSAVLFICFLALVILEDERLSQRDPYFSLFALVYETASAFGTVGLSLGYPDSVVSFSGQLRPVSKLLICVMIVMGRHRGLPHELDAAVALVSRARDDAAIAAALADKRRYASRPDDPSSSELDTGSEVEGGTSDGALAGESESVPDADLVEAEQQLERELAGDAVPLVVHGRDEMWLARVRRRAERYPRLD